MLEFNYDSVPFVDPARQIRLMTFPALSRPDKPLRCDLRVFALEDAPAFEALSYAWGEGANEVTVLCIDDEHRLRITQTLYDAMIRFSKDKLDPSINESSAWSVLVCDYLWG